MSVQKYRIKPVDVEAFQLTDEMIVNHVIDEEPLPFGLRVSSSTSFPPDRTVSYFRLIVDVYAGKDEAYINDWIVKNDNGFLIVYRPSSFEALYQEICNE